MKKLFTVTYNDYWRSNDNLIQVSEIEVIKETDKTFVLWEWTYRTFIKKCEVDTDYSEFFSSINIGLEFTRSKVSRNLEESKRKVTKLKEVLFQIDDKIFISN